MSLVNLVKFNLLLRVKSCSFWRYGAGFRAALSRNVRKSVIILVLVFIPVYF